MSILGALGWDLPAEELRTMARRNEESPQAFAKGLSAAIRESYLERRERVPYSMGEIRQAIEARMQEE